MEAYTQIIWTRDRIHPRCKNIAAYALSQLTNNRNQKVSHESNYSMETISELYDTNELTKCMFLIAFDHIGWYQQKDSFLTESFKCATYI